MPLKLLLCGARGRMGTAVRAVATEMDCEIVAALNSGDDPAAHVANCDVVVDFTAPDATERLLRLAIEHARPIVVGTTGHDGETRTALRSLASQTPTVWAGNFSVGVNLLFFLTQRAAQALGEEYDIELVEMHHRQKKDAPSGTAERLLEILQEARQLGERELRHGRHGLIGARPRREIGVHALRGGDVVGEHTVQFAALGERLELTHKASDRAIFARGALRAARWLLRRPAGLYDMQDVLGLR